MTHNHNNLAACHCAARQQADPIGIHHIDAEAGTPASACQTPAFESVKPSNAQSYDYVRIH